MRKPRLGYTLMEVILVLAIIIVVSAVSMPAITGLFRSSSLEAAADAVKAELTKTRNKAIEGRVSYRFAIKENTGLFRIAPDADDFWSGGTSGSSLNADCESLEPQVIEGKLPEKVCFGQTEGVGMNNGGGSEWKTIATFLADGSALEDVQVHLNMDGTSSKVIRLKADTGSITTAALPALSNAN